MFNVRYQFRKPKGRVVPKGPSFSFARTIKTEIDGTTLRFKAPRHSPERPSHKPVFPERHLITEKLHFRMYKDERISVPYDWGKFLLFDHAWIFNGPWFTGMQGNVQFYMNLVKPLNYSNSDFSLFHPRAFEQRLGDYLTYQFAGPFSDIQHKCYCIGPVEWQPYTRLPVVAARFKIERDTSIMTSTPEHFLAFPIADQLMVTLMFIPSQFWVGTQEEKDKRISAEPMLKLVEQIIASLEVELSPAAKAQQQAALAGLEDTSLVKEYPPLNWNNPELRPNKKSNKNQAYTDDDYLLK